MGIESFGFKNVCTGWADALRINVDGKDIMGLYMSETAKVTITDENGKAKEVNMYERTVNKKGEVYIKKTAKGADGSITTTFEQVEVEA